MSDIQAIKYRLVGAVVIVIGFASMWWLMLDHEAHRRIKNEHLDIPPQTMAIERFDIEEPKPLGIRPQEAGGVAESRALAEDKSVKNANSEEIKTTDIKSTVISPPQEEQPVPNEPKIAEEKSVPASATIAKKTDSYSALDEKGLPEAWVLQLASLKSEENARQLQRKLLASSYPAYIKSITRDDGVSYRVLVGPKLSHEKAVEMSKAIEKELGIKSMVLKFQTGYEQ